MLEDRNTLPLVVSEVRDYPDGLGKSTGKAQSYLDVPQPAPSLPAFP